MGELSLYVVRHGEPDDRSIFYGHHDVGLSARGLEQVTQQAQFFTGRSVAELVSSDLSRCTFGAAALAEAVGGGFETSAALREMHLGVLEGVSIEEARRSMPELAGRSYKDMFDVAFPGGGESVRQLAGRVMPEVERRVRSVDPRAGALVVYAHNMVARVVLACAAGLGPAGYARFEQGYGAINKVLVDPGEGDLWARSTVAWSNREPG